MAITNHERVGKAMDLLKQGLAPFVDREFKNSYKDKAATEATRFIGEDRLLANKSVAEWDTAALLKLMWEAWNDVFRHTLGRAERTLLSELRDYRNKWAHQQSFSSDDAYRALDSAGRLLTAVSAPQADEIEKMKMELLRLRFDEQVRTEKRKSAGTVIESAGAANLKPWREVVTPHKDVASGRYQQAEFAADLWQVYLGEGTDEYKNPAEFFRRTYLTESLKLLLVGAVQRISGQGGDPVVQLQTNFGGGKTHSMLALYHLFSGTAAADLVGIEPCSRVQTPRICPPPSAWYWSATKSRRATQSRSPTAQSSVPFGASSPGSSVERKLSSESVPMMRRPRVPATFCANFSMNTAHALSSLTSGSLTRANSTTRATCPRAASRRNSPSPRPSPNRQGGQKLPARYQFARVGHRGLSPHPGR
jgi:hypothetical protein